MGGSLFLKDLLLAPIDLVVYPKACLEGVRGCLDFFCDMRPQHIRAGV